MEGIKEKIKKTESSLMKEIGVANSFASPKLVKVTLSSGMGKISDKKKRELIMDRLTKIAGQKSAIRPAKKSIATFKLRMGDPIGTMVTLRGKKMYAFLDKLVHIAIPRMRDFQGIDPKALDEMGNLTIGIKEHTIFPETSDEDLRDVFGFSITIVTTAKGKEDAYKFFKAIGIPFKKVGV
jgi:large subunit ribosomal protein L5